MILHPIIYLIATFISFTMQSTISWKGLTWTIKQSMINQLGPGPNYWSSDNLYIDSNDFLHMKISHNQTNNKWTCSEVETQQRFLYGTFQWEVIGRVDALDKNIVLGLFLYPPDSQTGPDGSNQIDIQFSKWNSSGNVNNLYYTLFPRLDDKGKLQPSISNSTQFSLTGTYTTHRFTWTPDNITYQSMYGHYQNQTNVFYKWTTPSDKKNLIPQKALGLFINLWLFGTKVGPSDQQEVEIIINDFRYSKYQGKNLINQ